MVKTTPDLNHVLTMNNDMLALVKELNDVVFRLYLVYGWTIAPAIWCDDMVFVDSCEGLITQLNYGAQIHDVEQAIALANGSPLLLKVVEPLELFKDSDVRLLAISMDNGQPMEVLYI